ncbi:hypothetical protein ABFB09_07505 [Dehalogenimonas sp. THU2]|uniref:hypothetical protein n=1 Tax=Dehalogenimonas sp. THU2 TaxID=3151121 RepID=UPI003218714B
MKKPIITIVAVVVALLSALAMSTGVLAVILVPGDITADSTVTTGDAESIWDNDGGAQIGARVGVGATDPPPGTVLPDSSSGTATAKSHAVTTGDGSAQASTSAYVLENSAGTALADADASAIGDDTHAYANANSQIRSGSSGTTFVESNAVATGVGSDAQSDNSAYLEHGASGNLTSIGNSFASNGAYAYTDAEITLSELSGNLTAWTWVTSSGEDAWADGRAEIKYPGLDMTNGIVYNYALSPGVYFDYDVQGGNYGIAIVAVLDPTNIYAIAVSNSVDLDTEVLAKVYGQSVFVGVDIDERK